MGEPLMPKPPKPFKNPDHYCSFNVGFQSLASITSLKALFNNKNSYQSSPVREALFNLLYNDEVDDATNFIEVWNDYVRSLIDQLPPDEPQALPPPPPPSEAAGETSSTPIPPTERERLERLVIFLDRPNQPLLFLEDIFPRIWPIEEFPISIQPMEYKRHENITDDVLRTLYGKAKDGDPFGMFMVVLVEASYLKERAKTKSSDARKRKKTKGYFDKKMTIKKSATVDGRTRIYSLVSVIDHIPPEDPEPGHYIAYVRRLAGNSQEFWYRTSDTQIEEVDYKVVRLIQKPEILIYELKD